MTAARFIESVRRARAAGIRHYLVKPFSVQDLRTRLDHLAQNHCLLAGSGDTLVRVLHEAPLSSSSEIGTMVGISGVSTRRYLEFLVEARRAERTRDCATAGPPDRRPTSTAFSAQGRSRKPRLRC